MKNNKPQLFCTGRKCSARTVFIYIPYHSYHFLHYPCPRVIKVSAVNKIVRNNAVSYLMVNSWPGENFIDSSCRAHVGKPCTQQCCCAQADVFAFLQKIKHIHAVIEV